MATHLPVLKTFINQDLLSTVDADSFRSITPFPWHNFHEFLTPEGFETLYRDFPSLDLFEQHSGITRSHGQRPHNRYYLAYESSIYRSKQRKNGVIQHDELPKSWQQFIEELETSDVYRKLIRVVKCRPTLIHLTKLGRIFCTSIQVKIGNPIGGEKF
jgi:hypothetical protein